MEHPTTDERSFAAAIRHIHDVILDDVPPQHLAVDDSLPTAEALAALPEALGL